MYYLPEFKRQKKKCLILRYYDCKSVKTDIHRPEKSLLKSIFGTFFCCKIEIRLDSIRTLVKAITLNCFLLNMGIGDNHVFYF